VRCSVYFDDLAGREYRHEMGDHWQIVPRNFGVAMARISPDGKWLAANECLCDLLGSAFEEFSDTPFDNLFRATDPQVENDLRESLLTRQIPYYSSEREANRGDGKTLSTRIVFSLECEEANAARSILAMVEDLTALRNAQAALQESENARRELARRLTNAQEKERTRIARELHDDIGQSLAILRIQMLRAGQPVSGAVGKTHPTVADLCDNLKVLAEKVSRLSQELHSSRLEYLGLAVAIQSHCREFSEKFKIAVQCSCSNIPENLDSLFALSLLRIVQEALHNAGKHSNAKSILVVLEGSAAKLSLLISDDGVGFDLEEAKLAAGLGLISMRERVHMAGGEFKITSKPGEGTCITARVPLAESVLQVSPAADRIA
jgi:PAS domain S-box-containing protein